MIQLTGSKSKRVMAKLSVSTPKVVVSAIFQRQNFGFLLQHRAQQLHHFRFALPVILLVMA